MARTTQVCAIGNHGTSGSECHFNGEFGGGNFINRKFHKRLNPALTCFQIVDVNHVKNFTVFFASFTPPSTPGRSYSNLLPREGLTPTFYPGKSYSNLLLREGLPPTLYPGNIVLQPSTPGRSYSTFYPGKVLFYLPNIKLDLAVI